MGQLVQGRWRPQDHLTNREGAYHKASSGFIGEVSQALIALRAQAPNIDAYHASLSAYFSRFTLFGSLACPWVHRVLLARALGPVGEALTCCLVSGEFGEEGWRLPPERHPLPSASSYVHSLYTHTNPTYTGRVTLPLLWDNAAQRIISNDSSELMRALCAYRLSPPERLEELTREAAWLQSEVNIAPYRAGFAATQALYEQTVQKLFEALDQLEARLQSAGPYLLGEHLSELDLRLLPTLVRFDVAYVSHFKCNLKRITDYPALSAYLKRLCALPSVRETIDLHEIKRHYFRSVPKNDHLPLGPQVDFL